MTYRIVRVKRRGKALREPETWHSGIDAPSAAEAVRRFRESNTYYAAAFDPGDLAAVEVPA